LNRKLPLTFDRYGRKPLSEYSVVGYGTAASMLELALEKENPKDEPISYLFCGIGDARHLMRTIIDIAAHEKKLKNPSKKYHFLINNVKKCVMAQDLVIFMLLDELKNVDAHLNGLEE
jgi:hypothetical protein